MAGAVAIEIGVKADLTALRRRRSPFDPAMYAYMLLCRRSSVEKAERPYKGNVGIAIDDEGRLAAPVSYRFVSRYADNTGTGVAY